VEVGRSEGVQNSSAQPIIEHEIKRLIRSKQKVSGSCDGDDDRGECAHDRHRECGRHKIAWLI